MKKNKKNQSGRSMVEMLGVLAVIGVLSVGGIAGYKMAMEQIGKNKMLNLANQFALMVETEFNDWENSFFNDELCAPSACGDCLKEDTEYFCDSYGDPSYCDEISTNGNDCYYHGGYYLAGKNFQFGVTHGHAPDYPTINLKLGMPRELCPELLSALAQNDVFADRLLVYGSGSIYREWTDAGINAVCSAVHGTQKDKNLSSIYIVLTAD